MTTISLIGSHGTGKTTVFEELKRKRPDYKYFSSSVRYMMPILGYKNSWELTKEIGAGHFELMNLNSWSVIDPKQNTLLKPEDAVITDRSAVDCYAYFLTLRDKPADYELGNLIKLMAKHYASLITGFIHFPTGVFPLKGDETRPADERLQKKVDENIPRALYGLGIPEKRVYHIRSTSVDDRVEEVFEIVSRCNRK